MNRFSRSSCCVVLLVVAFACRISFAQAPSDWVQTGTGDWNDGANWSLGFVPVGQFGDIANITNGGAAQVANTPAAVGALTIGPGTLEILSGGSLSIEEDSIVGVSGALNVSGSGNILIATGGSLDAESATSAGTIDLTGPAATFEVRDNLGLSGTSRVIARIDGPNFSPISVDGSAALAGELEVQFSGVTLSPNSTWNIVDANAISGGFSSVTTSGGTGLGPGQVFAVRQQTGGANGNVAQLAVEQRLVLNVDRATGEASIFNPSASPIELDTYQVLSAVGSIAPGGWNSLQDQSFDGGNWFEFGTGGTSNVLAELNPNTVTSIGSSGSASIGTVFDPNFVTLGQETEDLEFIYSNPSAANIAGVVNYIGDKQFNNLVLTVNPDSGEAAIQNESEIPVAFDVYTVTSAAGSLLPADGIWNSLSDQGLDGGDWLEIDSDATKLGEVRADGVATLNQDGGFSLGQIFDPSGSQDLVFRFLLDGQSAPFDGVVVYGELPTLGGGGGGIDGDYNNNGQVEQGDLDLVLLNWGTGGVPAGWTNDLPEGNIDQAELDGVLLNWGNMAALGGVAGVPEPASVALLGVFLLSCPLIHRRLARY